MPEGDGVLDQTPADAALRKGIGQPGTGLLHAWAHELRRAWGAMPYLVGSALNGDRRGWRDVDVRMMLTDEAFDLLFGPDAALAPSRSPLLVAQNVAYSLWGQRVTGLPIDFQFQRLTEANEQYAPTHGYYRSAIGIGGEVDPFDDRVRRSRGCVAGCDPSQCDHSSTGGRCDVCGSAK